MVWQRLTKGSSGREKHVAHPNVSRILRMTALLCSPITDLLQIFAGAAGAMLVSFGMRRTLYTGLKRPRPMSQAEKQKFFRRAMILIAAAVFVGVLKFVFDACTS
jgi:hypothetical protein